MRTANPSATLGPTAEVLPLVFVSMNKFTVHYPNGIKRHINKSERDLLGASLVQIRPREYLSASLALNLQQAHGPNYLTGFFIWELAGQREEERMQTPKGQIERLEAMGWQAREEGRLTDAPMG